MLRTFAICGLLLTLVLTACGDDDDVAQPTTTVAMSAASSDDATTEGCADVVAPEPRGEGAGTAPADGLDPELTWTLTFDTSCGTFVVALDLESAPETSASLVALAEGGFFDDTVFHRIVPGFVIQGGDPTQSGSGGPGYETVDPPADDAAYVRGVVAMAKAATDPIGMAGSQFFVVTGSDVGLPPEYAVVGNVTEGIDVVTTIGTLGDPATEQPLRAVVIESVTAASSAVSR